MPDPIDDVLSDVFDEMGWDSWPFRIDKFQTLLGDCGFMIVPIEDPTNLRFGIDE